MLVKRIVDGVKFIAHYINGTETGIMLGSNKLSTNTDDNLRWNNRNIPTDPDDDDKIYCRKRGTGLVAGE